MSYAIVFGQNALRDIPQDIPEDLVGVLESGLEKLKKDPVGLSQRAWPVGPWGGQKYRICGHYQGREFAFDVFFYYRDNESEIRVYHVGFAWLS
jgi:hypothetical protein